MLQKNKRPTSTPVRHHGLAESFDIAVKLSPRRSVVVIVRVIVAVQVEVPAVKVWVVVMVEVINNVAIEENGVGGMIGGVVGKGKTWVGIGRVRVGDEGSFTCVGWDEIGCVESGESMDVGLSVRAFEPVGTLEVRLELVTPIPTVPPPTVPPSPVCLSFGNRSHPILIISSQTLLLQSSQVDLSFGPAILIQVLNVSIHSL
jgi:hypothetical protein